MGGASGVLSLARLVKQCRQWDRFFACVSRQAYKFIHEIAAQKLVPWLLYFVAQRTKVVA